ncbi:MAG: IPT/TIG domain-containing protein [Verrucomicrobiae bacterium]|nr:IPT/TIG domain-containing protein [Verrucomicrobiae bacterium]
MVVSPSALRRFLSFGIGFATLAGATAATAATVTGFAPDRGPAGTEVVIVGTGLQSATQVYFGTTEAPGEILARAATSVRVRVPPNAFSGPISVFTGTGAATSSQIFVAAPRIELFEPAFGIPGTEVQLFGANFATGLAGGRGQVTAVTFDGQAAQFQVVALNQLRAVVPPNARTGPIRVVNEAGSATTPVPFHVAAVLSGFAPPRARPGDTIEIRGSNLGQALRVEFGTAPAAFAAQSPTNLLAVVPTNAVRAALQIVTPAGAAFTSSNFVVLPRIISFHPPTGSTGTNVVLEGGGFQGVTDVQFNGVKASFTATSPTRVTAVVPAGATTGPIKIVTPDGDFTTEASFTLPPRITAFTPGTGRRGDTVTVDGQNLNGVTRLLFHHAEAPFTVVSPTRLTAVVPALATTGRLTLESPAGSEVSAATFTVLPVLDGFSPNTGPFGTAVHLAGAGLTNLAWVRLGDADATFTVIDATNVRVVVPLAAFSGPFHVRTAGGVEVSSSASFFVTGAQPVLNAFQPATGNAGTSVTLTGLGLRTASQVTFGSVNAPFTVVSGTELRATAPAGVTTGRIAVTTLDGIAVSASDFIVDSGVVRLAIEVAEGQLVLRWPAGATDYTLESSTVLGPDAAWAAVPGTPVVQGAQRTLTLPLPGTGTRYFRLRQ